MYHKTIFHTMTDGVKAKFTIRDKMIKNKIYYYANVINIDLDAYKNLPNDLARENFYGVQITDGNQNVIYYSDAQLLEKDIIERYGIEWLESEIITN